MAALPPIPVNAPVAAVSTEGYETFTTTALTGTSATACYTAATSTQRRITKLKKLVIANTTAGAINITVAYYNKAANVAYAYYPLTSLAAAGRLVFDDLEMTLEPQDELRVTGNTGVNVFVSAREWQGNVKS